MPQSVREKYLYKPFPGSSHSWALEHCFKLDPCSRVLDIGSGSGAIGQALKDKGFSSLFAVEIDAEAREHAKKIYSEAHENIEAFSKQRFDLILMLDVLEHLTNPFDFLSEICGLLDKNGTALISVPNVAHWSVRFPLLFGQFNYTQRGILDRTHFQFFTRKRFVRMLSTPENTEVIELASSIEPVEFVLPQLLWDNFIFRFLSKVRMKVASVLPGLMAYQHLGVVRARDFGG